MPKWTDELAMSRAKTLARDNANAAAVATELQRDMAGTVTALDRSRALNAELLAALERINTVLQGAGWLRHKGDAIEQVEAAIAKAKGAA